MLRRGYPADSIASRAALSSASEIPSALRISEAEDGRAICSLRCDEEGVVEWEREAAGLAAVPDVPFPEAEELRDGFLWGLGDVLLIVQPVC